MVKHRKWTGAEVVVLKKAYADPKGPNAAALAGVLRHSPETIRQMASGLGLRRPPGWQAFDAARRLAARGGGRAWRGLA